MKVRKYLKSHKSYSSKDRVFMLICLVKLKNRPLSAFNTRENIEISFRAIINGILDDIDEET